MNERNVKITKRIHADGSYASTYNVEVLNSFNPELQLKETVSVIKNKLINLLPKVRGFKFVTFLELKKIENDDQTKYTTFYFNSKVEVIINESDIDDIFELIYITTISNIQKYLGKGSSWITDSALDHITDL